MENFPFSRHFYIFTHNIIRESINTPMLHNLYVTDIGYFVEAQNHYKERKTGINEAILIFCEKGAGQISINSEKYQISEKQAIFIKPGTSHKYFSSSDKPWTILWAHFGGSHVELYQRRLGENPVMDFSEGDFNFIKTIFFDIFSQLKDEYTRESMVYCAQAFSAIVAKAFFNNKLFTPITNSPASEKIEATIRFMNSRIESTELPDLKMLAEKSELSPSHFSVLFKQQTGYSPYDYFLHLKMQRACKYLQTSDMKVYEIASILGYEDQFYFSRLFKKITGKSPADYRKHLLI